MSGDLGFALAEFARKAIAATAAELGCAVSEDQTVRIMRALGSDPLALPDPRVVVEARRLPSGRISVRCPNCNRAKSIPDTWSGRSCICGRFLWVESFTEREGRAILR